MPDFKGGLEFQKLAEDGMDRMRVYDRKEYSAVSLAELRPTTCSEVQCPVVISRQVPTAECHSNSQAVMRELPTPFGMPFFDKIRLS
ncbi:hypothetical protein [Granulicella aggregans]|uniref:hypothetical protein n=1 Tax=Granulicella aggregans TaxID=474949 RepID=UPI001C865F03|nr:hypothetical protein [Granulicella aggregans]